MCAYTLASASLEVQEAGNRRRRAPLTPAVCQLAWTCDSSRVGSHQGLHTFLCLGCCLILILPGLRMPDSFVQCSASSSFTTKPSAQWQSLFILVVLSSLIPRKGKSHWQQSS